MPDQKKSSDKIWKILRELYERKIPFNKVLGLKIESLKVEEVRVKFEMKDAFVGNYVH